MANRGRPNDTAAIVAFAERFGRVTGVAIESCSGAAHLAEELSTRAGWSVDLAHPGFVARMRQNRDKHDWGDARLLADLERVGYLPRVWLAPESIRDLRRLVRYRQQMAHQRRDLELRIGAMLRDQRLVNPPARPWTLRLFKWLRSEASLTEQSRWIIDRQLIDLERVLLEVREVELRLSAVTADDPVVDRLMSFKGIGPVTAWTLRAEIGRFDRFRTGKQLARFCGLSPRNASSGERQADSGLIKAGNRQLRATIIETAHRLRRFDPTWGRFGLKMEMRGKARCLVVMTSSSHPWVIPVGTRSVDGAVVTHSKAPPWAIPRNREMLG